MRIILPIKLALAAGIINCIAWFGVAKSLGYYSLNIGQYRYFITLFLLVLGVLISIYYERKKQSGFIEYKEAVKSGVIFSLVLAIIISVFNYVYYKFIRSDVIDFFVSEEKKAWLANNRTLEETNKYIIEYYIPSYGFFHILMTTLFLGIIISLVSGALFRKKNPHSFSTN